MLYISCQKTSRFKTSMLNNFFETSPSALSKMCIIMTKFGQYHWSQRNKIHNYNYNHIKLTGRRTRRRLPSYSHGFDSRAHHLISVKRSFVFVNHFKSILNFDLYCLDHNKKYTSRQAKNIKKFFLLKYF